MHTSVHAERHFQKQHWPAWALSDPAGVQLSSVEVPGSFQGQWWEAPGPTPSNHSQLPDSPLRPTCWVRNGISLNSLPFYLSNSETELLKAIFICHFVSPFVNWLFKLFAHFPIRPFYLFLIDS